MPYFLQEKLAQNCSGLPGRVHHLDGKLFKTCGDENVIGLSKMKFEGFISYFQATSIGTLGPN